MPCALPAGLCPHLLWTKASLPCSQRQTWSSSPRTAEAPALQSRVPRWAVGGGGLLMLCTPRPSDCGQCACVGARVPSQLPEDILEEQLQWKLLGLGAEGPLPAGSPAQELVATSAHGSSTLVLGVEVATSLLPSLGPWTCQRWPIF